MRTKIITYNPNNYQNTRMTGTIYAGGTKIRESKVVTTPRKIKTVTYGPVNYYGKQTKTKVIKKK